MAKPGKLRAACMAMAAALTLGAPAAASAAEAPSAYRGPNLAAQKAAMEKLAWLVGGWEGTGWTLLPSGERATFRQTETVEMRLDGRLMLIEGRGFDPAPGGPMVFNALAALSYSDAAGRYEFRSYAMGYAGTFEGEALDDGVFRWTMRPPGQIIRYTITRTPQGAWREVGERSVDGGAAWTLTHEMTLTRRP